MINVNTMCNCGNALVVDTVTEDGRYTQTNVQVYDVPYGALVTRVYCGYCGLMYHPDRAGIHGGGYTTPKTL